MNKQINPSEQKLEGQWVKAGTKVVADETAQRIEELISTSLTKIAISEDGWEVLYADEQDGRKWELTYPHKEWHGGGPPMLTCVSEDYSKEKYRIG